MITRRSLRIRRQVTSRRIRYAAPALEKGLDILELLACSQQPLTHSEIASRLGRTVTEVFRMLVCLEERGYISRAGPDESYQLTRKLFETVHHHHPLQRLVSQARGLVQQVASGFGESCHLAMLNGAEVVVVAQSDAPGNTGFSVRLGANIDLLNPASGQRNPGIPKGRSSRPCAGSVAFPLQEANSDWSLSPLNQIRRRGYEELASYQVHDVVQSAIQY
jgi:DNA-binding MarR family transcriptional regulator